MALTVGTGYRNIKTTAVNVDNQVNLWEQAQIAHNTADWSLLLQCMQLILEERGKRGEGERGRGRGERIDDVSSQSPSSPTDLGLDDLVQSQLIDWAMDVLVFGDFHQRWDVAKLLPKLGQRTIAPLIEILEDEDADEELHWFGIRILGSFNHPDAIATLVDLLKTAESEELKAMAAAALGEMGAGAVAALTELLVEESTRLLAVRSLCCIRCKETIAPLLSVVQDSQVEIRVAAIEALSSFRTWQIPSVLLEALNDLAAPVRREAVNGLGFRSDLQEELDLVNRLLPRLYDFNLDVCIAAAIALGRLGTTAAATGLFQCLQSPHTPLALQIEIVRALGRIETETSLEYLHSSLDQLTLVTLWQEIITVLGRIEQTSLRTKAAEILLELLQSHHPGTQQSSIKQAIALSLSQLGETQAVAALIQLLADPEMAVRLHAIAALKKLDPEARHQLEQIASDITLTPGLRQGVAIALQEW